MVLLLTKVWKCTVTKNNHGQSTFANNANVFRSKSLFSLTKTIARTIEPARVHAANSTHRSKHFLLLFYRNFTELFLFRAVQYWPNKISTTEYIRRLQFHIKTAKYMLHRLVYLIVHASPLTSFSWRKLSRRIFAKLFFFLTQTPQVAGFSFFPPTENPPNSIWINTQRT